MFNDAQEIEDNLQALGKYVDQIFIEHSKEEVHEPKRLGLDVEEHDKTYQQQKFHLRYDVLQNVDILSFDFSYFPSSKITK